MRSIPSLDRLLHHPEAAPLFERFSRELVADALREVLGKLRAELRTEVGGDVPDDARLIASAAEIVGAASRPSLGRVVNASGIVLHTNLGRAALAPEAIAAVATVAGAPCNLEYDIESGERGERDVHVEGLLASLTGAEAALVVNNNAAAVLLALNALAEDREVIVSRGELIEIGGSFRLPEILAKSGARLREVGTTNRTHLQDYELAIGPDTAVLLKVHPSNYRIEGFTAEVDLAGLVSLARAHGLPVMEDLGSGALVDLEALGLPREPVVAERIRLGADVVTFSADKLLGGPQAGLVVGRRAVVDPMRRNPLKRALRCDKMTIAALEATLRLYRSAPDPATALPTLRLLTRPLAALEALGQSARSLLAARLGADWKVEIVDSEAEVGSGSLPTRTLPSKAIVLRHDALGPDEIAALFRASAPPIVGRVHRHRFWLDLRAVERPEDLLPTDSR